MTAQVGDRFIYDKKDYTFVAISNPIEFNPKDYGMIPEPRCSACWQGYWCIYRISEDGIILEDFYINSKDDYYPEINGVKSEIKLRKNGKPFTRLYMGHQLYKSVNIKMSYTGQILVGGNFIHDYYIHMGYQQVWAYEVLTELVFKDGVLIDTVDHSNVAAELRRKIKDNPSIIKERYTNVEKFVEVSFSKDMATKAWWIR